MDKQPFVSCLAKLNHSFTQKSFVLSENRSRGLQISLADFELFLLTTTQKGLNFLQSLKQRFKEHKSKG